ncbi:MAG: hypothetical protein AB8G16_00225 [Gammaproteobacteria bacterium]
MNDDKNLDELAHEMARGLQPANTPSQLTDAELQAYLDGPGGADIETRLARDDAARQRLATLAGVAPVVAPTAVRERILGPEPAPVQPNWLTRIAAVVAMLAVGLAVWMSGPTGPTAEQRRAFAALDYSTSLQGLARVRGVNDARPASAYPDSLVSIEITPTVSTSLPLHYALFAGRPPHQQRLQPVSIQSNRGAVTLKFHPEQYAALQPGPLRLQVVVSLHELPTDASLFDKRDKIFDYDLLILAR